MTAADPRHRKALRRAGMDLRAAARPIRSSDPATASRLAAAAGLLEIARSTVPDAKLAILDLDLDLGPHLAGVLSIVNRRSLEAGIDPFVPAPPAAPA